MVQDAEEVELHAEALGVLHSLRESAVGDHCRESLTKAWEALLASIMVVVTGLAVLLPWLLLALVIAWFVRRWLRHRNGSAGPAASAKPTTD